MISVTRAREITAEARGKFKEHFGAVIEDKVSSRILEACSKGFMSCSINSCHLGVPDHLCKMFEEMLKQALPDFRVHSGLSDQKDAMVWTIYWNPKPENRWGAAALWFVNYS